MELPKYDGDECIIGYLEVFDELCDEMDYSESTRKANLVSKLEGSARAWLMGQGKTWRRWSLGEMKEAMVTYFGEENRMHARKLQNFK